MRALDASNAADYLRSTGRVPPKVPVRVVELAGGVSNVVLRVEVDDDRQPPFVLKQCRERLRVAQEWRAPLRRIWTECAALQVVGELLPGTVPAVLFEDRDQYLFAMECADDRMVTWKSRLMAGASPADRLVALEVGRVLRQIHLRSVDHLSLRGLLADTSLFEQLRVDPYYRTVARVHPHLAPALDDLIASMPAVRPALVLGDYSPKNLLVGPEGRLLLLDFECAHAGDPAFDVGFCLSHLVLKLVRACGRPAEAETARSFLAGYRTAGSADPAPPPDNLEDRLARAARHAAACLLARLDGKSPVEYRHELDQDRVRRLAAECLTARTAWNPDRLIGEAQRRAAGGAA
ncbi:MAG: putative aminoglycoside phosphotransferase [Isosphaeraceae bacterium]|jgi:5-methylthioribose kinase|nr:MAG: putative aminoglycoside phosphotransferase [Isosphaeraceae bacterium]